MSEKNFKTKQWAKKVAIGSLLTVSLAVFFQNCSPASFTSEDGSQYASASKEDEIFIFLQEAYDLSDLLKTYDFKKMVLKNDSSLDPEKENTKTWNLADDLREKADQLNDLLLVQKVAMNSTRVLLESDQLLNLLSKGRDQKVAFELMGRDIVLQVRIDDLQTQVDTNYNSLMATIGRVRADLSGFKDMVNARFVVVETSIGELKGRFDKFSSAVDTFMSEQAQTNATLGKAISDAKASLGEQIAKEEQERKALGIKLSNDFSAALATAKAELNNTIEERFRTAALKSKELEDKIALSDASLRAAIAAGNTTLAKQIEATKSSLQAEMRDQISVLRAETLEKIAATNASVDALKNNLKAIDDRLTVGIKELDAKLKTELLKQKVELTTRINENTAKIADLEAAIVKLTEKGEVTDALLAQIRKELSDAKAQEQLLADLQGKICKTAGETNCISIEEINCDAMFDPGSASNVQCKTIVMVLVNHDQQLRALATLTAAHSAALDNLTRAFQDMNNRVIALETSVGELSGTVTKLASNLAAIDAKFEAKISTLNALVASTNEKVLDILPRLSAVEGSVDELKVAVDAMGDLNEAAREEILKAIAAAKSEINASVDAKLAPLNSEIAKINEKLEGMAIDIAVLKFNKERQEIMSGLKTRIAFNSAWIVRRTADVRSQFCTTRTNSALSAFDYEAAKQNWVFCHEKLSVLNRAAEMNSIALGYTEALGSINIDATCSTSIKNAAGNSVRADLLTVKDLLNADVLKAVQAACGSKGRPAAVALMVNVMKFLKLVGPDHRTYEYLGNMSSATSAILLGAPYNEVSETQLKSFRNIDPTSDELAGTPYGQIERLFANRYIESTFRIGGRADGVFPENPNAVKQPSNLATTMNYGVIATGSYSDPSFGQAFGTRLKALEIDSKDVGFTVVARNQTSPGSGKRYRFPRNIASDACPVDDDVLVRHSDSKWYGYHVSYNHVNEVFTPVLYDGLHSAIATDNGAKDDKDFRTYTQLTVDRAGLTLAKIPRRTVLRATRPYGNAYNRANCVKTSLVSMLRKGEWEYQSGATATDVVQRNQLSHYLTGFSESMIKNTCERQTYSRTKWVQTSGAPKYKTICEDVNGAVISCTSKEVANTVTVQDGFEDDVLRLIAEADSKGNVYAYSVGTMNFRNLVESNAEMRTSFSVDGAATNAAQRMVSTATTQLAEDYWMYRDKAVEYTGKSVKFSSGAPFVRSYENATRGISSLSFVREVDKNSPIIVRECEHCPGNTKILGPCNKTINTKASAERI